MDNDNSENKLEKNTTRVVGIKALRRIRTLVDNIEEQDRKNQRNATVLGIIFALSLASLIYYIFYREPANTIIEIGPNKTHITDSINNSGPAQ